MSEIAVTVPLNGSIAPIIKESRELKDVYVWKTGNTMQLSKREWVIADTFLRTRSYAECSRNVEKECGKKVNWLTCKRWIEGRSWVRDWMKEQIEERGMLEGWSEGRWLKVMTDHLEGRKRLMNGDLYAMKLIAQVKGWSNEGSAVFNQQINFMQSNGVA